MGLIGGFSLWRHWQACTCLSLLVRGCCSVADATCQGCGRLWSLLLMSAGSTWSTRSRAMSVWGPQQQAMPTLAQHCSGTEADIREQQACTAKLRGSGCMIAPLVSISHCAWLWKRFA